MTNSLRSDVSAGLVPVSSTLTADQEEMKPETFPTMGIPSFLPSSHTRRLPSDLHPLTGS